MTYDTVIIDSHVILPQGMVNKNIVIDEEKIVDFTSDVPSCDNKINGNGLISIPGVIDPHVHYGVYSSIEKAPGTNSLREAKVEITSDIIQKVVQNAASLGCPVLVHAEDYEMCSCGIKTAKEKNEDGLAAWSQSRSTQNADKSIKLVSNSAREWGCAASVVPIGSADAL